MSTTERRTLREVADEAADQQIPVGSRVKFRDDEGHAMNGVVTRQWSDATLTIRSGHLACHVHAAGVELVNPKEAK